MNNMHLLPLGFQIRNVMLTIYPVVLHDDKEVVLVDCGYPYFMEKIEEQLVKIGLSLSRVTKLIITHHDHDHMGSLKEIKEAYPSIEILCSKEQEPFITGKSKSLRLIQAENLQDTLPEKQKEAGREFIAFISSIEPVKDVNIVEVGEQIDCCGGIEIIDTKGHMPGHISLYVREEKTLITGDALVIENGKLCIALPQFALNMKDAQDSVKALLDYDIEKVICYHGGVYDKDVRNSLLEIVSQFSL